MFKNLSIYMILFTLSFSNNLFAKENLALGYDSVIDFINVFSNEGYYKKDELVEIFARTKITEKIIKESNNQPEIKMNWDVYQHKVVSNSKIESGKLFLKEHFNTLSKAEYTFGVPKEIIVSILGIESFYGKYKGSYNAMNSLSTMAFQGGEKRRKFFKKELESFLILSFENKENPNKIMSSWAGAFGYPQFLPSSIRSYAVDFDNDGKIDLINSIDDSIGSIANYLSKNGWIKNDYIAEKITIKETDSFSLDLNKFSLNYTVEDVINNNGKFNRNMRKTKKLKVFILENENGIEYWVGYNNFSTITKYNRSNLYAMAVFDLANKIKNEEVK